MTEGERIMIAIASAMLRRSYVARLPGTVSWRHPDERPTLRDAEGRTMATCDAWVP